MNSAEFSEDEEGKKKTYLKLFLIFLLGHTFTWFTNNLIKIIFNIFIGSYIHVVHKYKKI